MSGYYARKFERPEDRARQAADQGYAGRRQDRASPEGRQPRHSPGRCRRRRLGRFSFERNTSRGSRSMPGLATTPSGSTRPTASSPTRSRRRSTVATATTARGRPGAETLLGGDGNDSIDGNQGNDLALMGAGDDTFVWDPGDGSDVVEGQDGADTMRFNGANAAEKFDLSANGSRLRFFRDIGNITMDTAGVERVDFNALGGADRSPSTTCAAPTSAGQRRPCRRPRWLRRRRRSRPGRRQRHRGRRRVRSAAMPGRRGLRPRRPVAIQHQEPSDGLAVNGLGGADSSTPPRSRPARSRSRSTAAPVPTRSPVARASRPGRRRRQRLDRRQQGQRPALMGAGDDTFFWDPGDGSDIVEGQDGADTMLFNGANVADRSTFPRTEAG